MTPSVWRAAHPDRMIPAATVSLRIKIRTTAEAGVSTSVRSAGSVHWSAITISWDTDQRDDAGYGRIDPRQPAIARRSCWYPVWTLLLFFLLLFFLLLFFLLLFFLLLFFLLLFFLLLFFVFLLLLLFCFLLAFFFVAFVLFRRTLTSHA
jgi:hypothetical protein